MIRKCWFIVTLVFAGACADRAAIVTFDFSTASGINSSWNIGTITDPNATVSGFADGVGISAMSGAGRLNASAWTQTGGSSAAEGNNDYFGFAITPNSGYSLNLDSAVATFTLQVTSTGPHSYSLVEIIGGGNLTDLQDGIFSSGAQTTSFGYTFSSSGNDNITSKIEFRIYGYDATSGSGTLSANAFSLGGTVTAVPEPAECGTMAGIASLALFSLRVWRQGRSGKN